MQQGVQTDATCNIQQCWELLANNAASVCTGLKKEDVDFISALKKMKFKPILAPEVKRRIY